MTMIIYEMGAVTPTTEGYGFNVVGVHGRPLVSFNLD